MSIRLKLAAAICPLFPPILSQKVRTYLYPRNLAIRENLDFSKKSVTGSYLEGNTIDFHAQPFAVHGFSDWRNVIAAHSWLTDREGDIIEVGANVGTETISFCDIIAGKGTVHAFEPLPQNLFWLEKLKPGGNNLKIYPQAVSHEEKEVKFEVPALTKSGNGKIIMDAAGSEKELITTQTIRLDGMKAAFKQVQLIAIDTEGHEPFVLQGCTQIIEEQRPAVIIEVEASLLKTYANMTVQDIYDFFAERNYQCYAFHRFGLKPIQEELTNPHASANWICMPAEEQAAQARVRKAIRRRSFIPWYLLRKL